MVLVDVSDDDFAIIGTIATSLPDDFDEGSAVAVVVQHFPFAATIHRRVAHAKLIVFDIQYDRPRLRKIKL